MRLINLKQNFWLWGMGMNYKLCSYAVDFVSFLIQELDKDMEKVKAIILFGSTARGEATSESDVDIFVDTAEVSIENKVKKIVDNFYKSRKYSEYWKLLGVSNDIKCMVGKLSGWKTLERSIISSGLTLYDKYKGKYETTPYTLFIISVKKKRNESVKVWRKLYGYTQKVGKKIYRSKGLVEDYGGKKITKGIMLMPLGNSQQIIDFLKKEKIQYQVIEFLTDAKI